MRELRKAGPKVLGTHSSTFKKAKQRRKLVQLPVNDSLPEKPTIIGQ